MWRLAGHPWEMGPVCSWQFSSRRASLDGDRGMSPVMTTHFPHRMWFMERNGSSVLSGCGLGSTRFPSHCIQLDIQTDPRTMWEGCVNEGGGKWWLRSKEMLPQHLSAQNFKDGTWPDELSWTHMHLNTSSSPLARWQPAPWGIHWSMHVPFPSWLTLSPHRMLINIHHEKTIFHKIIVPLQ